MAQPLLLNASPLPDIPWQDRPAGCSDVVWRYDANPIIPRDATPTSNSVFNSAVVPFGDGYAGGLPLRRPGAADGHPRRFQRGRRELADQPEHHRLRLRRPEIGKLEYRYDPRVCWIEDRYYVSWCNGYHGPTIGLAYTHDFVTFHQLENAFLPYNRNGVLFPRRIDGRYAMLSRPSDRGHTPFGDMYYSESPDLCFWGRHRFVMAPTGGWQSTKVGPGPTPIETREGWLLFYHGVLTSCNGFVYSFGAALLDLDQPWKVIYRTEPYLLSPQLLYECVGDVPNVAFPCAALCDGDTGRLAIYYGCADTVTGLAFATVDEVIAFTKANSL